MFNDYDPCQPDYYSAPAFDPCPPVDSFDPFELTFDQPEPYQQHPDDPMAYVVPAVVDAYAFDHSAPNAAVGFAMNEIARMQHLSEEQARAALDHVQAAVEVCAAHRLTMQMHHGFPWIPYETFMSLPRESRSDYIDAQRDYENLTGVRID